MVSSSNRAYGKDCIAKGERPDLESGISYRAAFGAVASKVTAQEIRNARRECGSNKSSRCDEWR